MPSSQRSRCCRRVSSIAASAQPPVTSAQPRCESNAECKGRSNKTNATHKVSRPLGAVPVHSVGREQDGAWGHSGVEPAASQQCLALVQQPFVVVAQEICAGRCRSACGRAHECRGSDGGGNSHGGRIEDLPHDLDSRRPTKTAGNAVVKIKFCRT